MSSCEDELSSNSSWAGYFPPNWKFKGLTKSEAKKSKGKKSKGKNVEQVEQVPGKRIQVLGLANNVTWDAIKKKTFGVKKPSG